MCLISIWGPQIIYTLLISLIYILISDQLGLERKKLIALATDNCNATVSGGGGIYGMLKAELPQIFKAG